MGMVPKNFGAKVITKRTIEVHEPTSGDDNHGAGIDRDGAESALLIVSGLFTADQDGSVALAVKVRHSDEDDNYDDDHVETITKTITAASAGVARFCFTLPIDLSGAQRWISPSVKLTQTTLTMSDHAVAAVVVLGGLVEKPHADFDGDGYMDNDLSDVAPA